MKTVLLSVPLKRMMEDGVKLVPVAVRTKVEPPGVIHEGEIDANDAAG